MTHKPDNSRADATWATSDRKTKFWHNPRFPKRVAKAIVYTLLLVSVVAGLLTFTEMLDARYKATVSEWPTVAGTVISTAQGDRRDIGYRRPTLIVKFTYVVQGDNYQGSQELIGGYESKYPIGGSVTVHYDPTRPNRSLIVPSSYIWRPGYWPALIAGFLGIVGLIFLTYLWGWWIRGK